MWHDQYELFPYQQEASEFMQEYNTLLAFDMGTGKTPTTLHAIESIREGLKGDRPLAPGIILAPSSLLRQWASEISKFTDQQNVLAVGSPSWRKHVYGMVRSTGSDIGYLLMTYDVFVRDQSLIQDHFNGFLILDEATAIKSFKSKRTRTVKECRDNYSIRFALTGTPVENGKPEELFSIMEWVEPTVVGPWWKFEKNHVVRNGLGWVESYKDVDTFHRKVSSNMLRKTADDPDVSAHLPKVVYMPPLCVSMDGRMDLAYTTMANDLLNELVKSIEDKTKGRPLPLDWSEEDPDHPDGKVMSKIQTIRMLLDHPVSVYASAVRYEDPDDMRGSAYSAKVVADGLIDGVKPLKAEAFEDYLKEFLDRDPKNKAVVFCSFVDVADALHASTGFSSVLFTGTMAFHEKNESLNKFRHSGDVRVFISTDAGGYGLDLPQANLVINYDLPWQAGLLAQRNARVRRASSQWGHVFVQDILVESTIEERLSEMLHHKIAVSKAVVDGEGILEDGSIGSSLESLMSFLRATL